MSVHMRRALEEFSRVEIISVGAGSRHNGRRNVLNALQRRRLIVETENRGAGARSYKITPQGMAVLSRQGLGTYVVALRT